jgi:hypothetical protein
MLGGALARYRCMNQDADTTVDLDRSETMVTRIQLIIRSIALATLLCLAPVSFGGTASDGVGTTMVRPNEACAEGEECCNELFSFCGEKPNMTPCKKSRWSGG